MKLHNSRLKHFLDKLVQFVATAQRATVTKNSWGSGLKSQARCYIDAGSVAEAASSSGRDGMVARNCGATSV